MKVVIIGSGPAGITVAETLCRNNFDGEIVMLSGEPYPPYSPPGLAEYFLTGREFHLWRGRDFPAGLKINYRPGSAVTSVLPSQKTLNLSDGSKIAYDRLVVASGSRLFAPFIEQHKAGVYNLKSLSSAEEFIGNIRSAKAKNALVIGAGFIGVEIGLTLAEMGLKVIQVVRSRVLRGVLDDELSRSVERIMEQHGIKILSGVENEAIGFVGESRITGMKTRNGDIIDADLIVAATGIRPNVEYLKDSGIAIDAGVIVNDRMRTNIPEISAAGDVVIVPNRLTGERYVHGNFANAVEQAQIIAYDIMGYDVPYEGAETMNSMKHLGMPMIVAGHMGGEEMRVKQGDYIRKIYLKDNRIIGYRLLGDIRSAGIYRTLMNRRTNVSSFKDRLLAPGFGMGYLEAAAASPAAQAF